VPSAVALESPRPASQDQSQENIVDAAARSGRQQEGEWERLGARMRGYKRKRTEDL
jgi:hypothetical protein